MRAIPFGCALTLALATCGGRGNTRPSASADPEVGPSRPAEPLEAPPPELTPVPPAEPEPPKCTDYPPALPAESLPDYTHIRQPLAGVEGLGAIVEVEAGEYPICAVDCHGHVYCWYPPNEYEVEDEEFELHTPERDLEGAEVVEISVGSTGACGVTGEGKMLCYGDPAKRWKALAELPRANGSTAGANNRCVMTEEGVYCWGENWRNALGLGHGRIDEPTKLPVPLAQASVQHDYGCGVTPTAEVLCWGANAFYQSDCGGRSTGCPDVEEPLSADHPTIPGLSGIDSISTGWEHACALTKKGEVLCWGSNDAGESGGPSKTDSGVPRRVEGLPEVVAMEAGFQHTCALTKDGEAYCWGSNIFGQIGPMAADEYRTPKKLSGLPKLASVSPGDTNTCVLTESGHVLCWGVAPDPRD